MLTLHRLLSAPAAFRAALLSGSIVIGEASWQDDGGALSIVLPPEHSAALPDVLALLAEHAFDQRGLLRLCCAVARDEQAPYLQAGFTPIDESGETVTLLFSRAQYLAGRRAAWVCSVYDAMCAYEAQVPHRIHHFVKVHSFARQIALHEGLSAEALFTLEIAALTHDIGIKPALAQLGTDAGPHQERLGPPEAVAMLAPLGLPQDVIDRVCFLIAHHHTTVGVDAIDWRILLEADFLVNMIEGNASPAAIDSVRERVFRTDEGKRLLDQIRPQA